MSDVRQLYSFLNKRRIGSIFAFLILLLLFIYPNPDGIIFNLLRASFLGIGVLIFLQLYKTRNKDNLTDSSIDELSLETNDSTELSKKPDVSLRVRFIMDLMAEAMPGFGFAYYDYRGFSEQFLLVETSGENISFSASISSDPEWMSAAISEGKFLTISQNSDSVRHFFTKEARISDAATLLTLPVKRSGSTGGALIIHAHQFSHFKDYHRSLGESFASALSSISRETSKGDLTLEHFSFFQQLEAFQADLDIARSKEQFVDAITEFCRKNFTYDKLSLILLDIEREDEAIAEKVIGYTSDFGTRTRFHRQKSLLWDLLDSGEPLIADLLEHQLVPSGRFNEGDLGNHHFFSYIGVPIKSKGEIMGCLVLESLTSGRYRSKEGGNLQILCGRLGMLLDWWQKYNIVRETAMHDGLTNLLNYGSFVELFQQELQRVSRYKEELVLLILDLDSFKRINDTYGHLYGDYVLKETSEILKSAVRNIDIVARYGGEEFAIVLVKAGKNDSIDTARRIVASVAEHKFKKDGISVRMTISAGMSEYPHDGEGVKDLIARADRAMYEAKKRGGNEVGISGEI